MLFIRNLVWRWQDWRRRHDFYNAPWVVLWRMK